MQLDSTLIWWNERQSLWPLLTIIAKHTLCVPASSATSERSFSKTGHIRDVPGKEWEKTGMGKKRERNTFFPFPFLLFWAPVFFPLLAKIMKNGEKRGGTAKKRQERCGTAKNGHSTPFQIVEFGEILVFLPFKTRFGPRSNPFFTPFFSRSCPFLFPFLSRSCTA